MIFVRKECAEKNQVVCQRAEKLLLSGILSASWVAERKNPHEEDGSWQCVCGENHEADR